MRNHSKSVVLLAALIAVFAFVSCTNSATGENPEEPGNVITEFDSTHTIFIGENDFGNWGEGMDEEPWLKFYCTGFSAGDQIQITHTKSEIYGENKTLELWDARWKEEMLTGSVVNGKRKSGCEKHIIPTTYNQTTTYTLSAKEAQNINTSGGFVILGCGLNITKVSINVKGAFKCFFLKNGMNMCASDDSFEQNYFTMSFDLVFNGDRKSFRFYYAYDADTKKLSISKASDVKYNVDSDGNATFVSEKTIFQGGTFTATYSSTYERLKFDSLPVKELSDYLIEKAYYPSPDFVSQYGPGNGGSSTEIAGSTYRGVMRSSSETVYIEFTFTDDTNWCSQGYTNDTFTTKTNIGSTSGTYSISGTSITINMPMFNATLTGTTSDNWATIVCTGEQMFTGTIRKL